LCVMHPFTNPAQCDGRTTGDFTPGFLQGSAVLERLGANTHTRAGMHAPMRADHSLIDFRGSTR